MATTNLKLTATADTSDAKRKLDDLKKQSINVTDEIAQKNRERLKEAIGLIAPVAVGVQALMRVIDGAISKVQEFIGRVANYRDAYAKTGENLDKLAQSLNATTAETIRLQAAADAAGIGAKDYAAALDKIKAGTITLDQQATAWESIASSASIAQSRSRLFASYIARARQQREIEIGTAEEMAAQLGGLGVHGQIGQSFLDDILAGRSEAVTYREYSSRATQMGIGLQTMGVDSEAMPIVIRALNDFIAEQNRALKAAQEETARQNRATADEIFKMVERFMAANGGDLDAALISASIVKGMDVATARKWYEQGYSQLSAEELEMRRVREEQQRLAEEAKRPKTPLEEAIAAGDQNLIRHLMYGFRLERGTNAGEDGGTASAAAALKWAFSEGGGLLAGVNYGFGVFQNDAASKIVSAIANGTKETTKELKGISKKLED